MSKKQYGKCFKCKRVFKMLSLTFPLVQVEFFEGHLRVGEYHHKSFCVVCQAKADELTEACNVKNTRGKNKNGKKGHHK